MANSSEFYHFLKSDRHISAFSVQAQEVLTESVQMAFTNLVNCFRVELSQTLNQFLSENIDHESAAGLVMTVLGSAMALLRRSRVNAALTIQLFSQLFHYINVICFNAVRNCFTSIRSSKKPFDWHKIALSPIQIVTNPHMCNETWGKVISVRLQILETWAHKQGLELAAECHLAKINQCADFLQVCHISHTLSKWRAFSIDLHLNKWFSGWQIKCSRRSAIGLLMLPLEFIANGSIASARDDSEEYRWYSHSNGRIGGRWIDPSRWPGGKSICWSCF